MLIGLPIIGGCFYMTMEELRVLTETPQVKLKPLHSTENHKVGRTLVLLSLRLRPTAFISGRGTWSQLNKHLLSE